MKVWADDYSGRDLASFQLWRQTAPRIVTPSLASSAIGAKPPGEGHVVNGLDDSERQICTALGIAPEAFLKTKQAEGK